MVGQSVEMQYHLHSVVLWGLDCLGLNPSSAMIRLGNHGQVTQPLRPWFPRLSDILPHPPCGVLIRTKLVNRQGHSTQHTAGPHTH